MTTPQVPDNSANVPASQSGTMPSTNMAIAVIGTILGLCSLLGFVFGAFGIYYATEVPKKWAKGDAAGAQKASKNARLFGIVAIFLGIIGAMVGLTIRPMMA